MVTSGVKSFAILASLIYLAIPAANQAGQRVAAKETLLQLLYLDTSKASSSGQKYSTQFQSIEQQDALELVRTWLKAKPLIFAPPYSFRLVSELTIDQLNQDVMKAREWLIQKEAYYKFNLRQISYGDRFVASQNSASIDVWIIEDRALYVKDRLDSSKTAQEESLVRYDLKRVGNSWKISNYKILQ